MKTHRLETPPELLYVLPESVVELDGKEVVIVNDNSLFTLVRDVKDDTVLVRVKRLWLKEIEPVKSAFQEWNGKSFASCQCRHCNDSRKEGWNAMNDRIVNDPQITLTPSEVEKIKALREP